MLLRVGSKDRRCWLARMALCLLTTYRKFRSAITARYGARSKLVKFHAHRGWPNGQVGHELNAYVTGRLLKRMVWKMPEEFVVSEQAVSEINSAAVNSTTW